VGGVGDDQGSIAEAQLRPVILTDLQPLGEAEGHRHEGAGQFWTGGR